MDVSITTEQIERYQRDGATVLRNVFDGKWIDVVRKGIEINLKSPSKYAEWLKVIEFLH